MYSIEDVTIEGVPYKAHSNIGKGCDGCVFSSGMYCEIPTKDYHHPKDSKGNIFSCRSRKAIFKEIKK